MNENEGNEEPLLIKENKIKENNINKIKRNSINSTTSSASITSNNNEFLCKYIFDYEVDRINKNNEILTLLPSLPSFPDEPAPILYKCESVPCYKKNFLKKLVSENRVRLQTQRYDLDLVYITKRVLAMSFPASGCEALYRNSYIDVLRYLREEFGDEFKIYNLCREPSRIYPGSRFPSVALFPFDDHQCCPIKFMLEFVVDVSLFLLRQRRAAAAVHCKAGKGRTGTMICAYMIFAGIVDSAEKSFEVYGSRRSYVNRGVTVPSQRRYIQHFETFLSVNFKKPYYKLIPRIFGNIISSPNGNILNKLLCEQDYYDFEDNFGVKRFTIGPFHENIYPHIRLVDFKRYILFDSSATERDKFTFYYIKKSINITGKGANDNKKHIYYFNILFPRSSLIINSDFNIEIQYKGSRCSAWVNLFFNTVEQTLRDRENITTIPKENYIHNRKNLCGFSSSFIEMREMPDKDNKDNDKDDVESFDYFQMKKEKYKNSNDNLIKKQKDCSLSTLNIKDILTKNRIKSKIWNMKLKGNDIDDFDKAKNIPSDFNIEIEYEIYE